ncbi:MAG: BrnA antitoxin family protein [Desulfosalsimonadaceae bacterium]|nr:BrnA antitoxin family protein [Desulfosalsimonadaceae bacterium]
MAKNLPLIDEDGEVRELTADDFKRFKPAAEVLPPELLAVLPRRGRPPVESPRRAMNIRLAPDVLIAFKSTGKGWQTRINDALRDWLKNHSPV